MVVTVEGSVVETSAPAASAATVMAASTATVVAAEDKLMAIKVVEPLAVAEARATEMAAAAVAYTANRVRAKHTRYRQERWQREMMM